MAEQELQELQQTLQTIYNKNLSYLQNMHPKLFNEIVALEQNNPNRWSISFENNRFELLNHNGEKTYNCDPFYDAQARANNITNAPAFQLIKTDKTLSVRHEDYELDAPKFLNEYIEELQNHKPTKTHKFIFLGTLLGIHLNDIHRIIQASSYLIVEESLEVFRLSMFLTDYTELATSSKLFFVINKTHLQKESIVQQFLDHNSEYNQTIHFELASQNSLPLIEELSSVIQNSDKLNYPYSEYLLSFKRGFDYLKLNHSILKLEELKILKDRPVLFLGGGHSLKSNIKFVQENQEKFVIVTVAALLKLLHKHSIKPDLIISSDSSQIITEQFNVQTSCYEKSIILCSNKTHPDVVEQLNNNQTFFFNDSLQLLADTTINTGVNVGNIGHSILLKLGVNELYMLGFDASIDKQTQTTHITKEMPKHELKTFDIENDQTENTLIKVKGNFEEFVYTTSHFKNMLNSFEESSKLSEGKHVYNLSNGAFIPNTLPLRPEDAHINTSINKDEIRKSLHAKLLQLSKTIRQDSAKEVNENPFIINQLSLINSTDMIFERFSMLNKNYVNNILVQILRSYFELINPYYHLMKSSNKKYAEEIYFKQFKKIIQFLEE